MRASRAACVRPKLLLVRVTKAVCCAFVTPESPGEKKFVWFKTFVASARSSTRCVSLKVKIRDKPASMLKYPGPRSIAGLMFPTVPGAGLAKAFLSTQKHVGLGPIKSFVHLLP